MKRRDFIRKMLVGSATGVTGSLLPGCSDGPVQDPWPTGNRRYARERPPNVIMILADDLGYGDLGCYDAEGFDTPHLNRMAGRGVRFTDFYAASPICSPTRASLLTGCYPQRVSFGDVLEPNSEIGLHPGELTLSESLQARGYRTACFGKWHLGSARQFMPLNKGFDEFYGLPYSNDMAQSVSTSPDDGRWPDHLPLIEGDSVIALDPDQSELTGEYTRRAVRFIQQSRGSPFFIYLSHSMPHYPISASRRFRGRSGRGEYGDVIQEIDWSVGQIMQTLQRLGLENDTLVMFASDNGPATIFGDWGGRPGPLRGQKTTALEGGMRVPFIMHWPGQIPAGGVTGELATMMDIFPTVVGLAGAPLPARPIDGKHIWSLTRGGRSPHDAFFYYMTTDLHAVRDGRWKLHFPHTYLRVTDPGVGGEPGGIEQADMGSELYDLRADPGEQYDLALQHPQVVSRLNGMANWARRCLGDGLTGHEGTCVRAPGRVEEERL